MKLKQFVIRVRCRGRGTDHSIVTRDPLDVYARCREVGLAEQAAMDAARWARRARYGDTKAPEDWIVPIKNKVHRASILCRDPMREGA